MLLRFHALPRRRALLPPPGAAALRGVLPHAVLARARGPHARGVLLWRPRRRGLVVRALAPVFGAVPHLLLPATARRLHLQLVTYSCVLSHSRGASRASRRSTCSASPSSGCRRSSAVRRSSSAPHSSRCRRPPWRRSACPCGRPQRARLRRSLPSIRDVYRTMLLGTDGLDALQITHEDRECRSARSAPTRRPTTTQASRACSSPTRRRRGRSRAWAGALEAAVMVVAARHSPPACPHCRRWARWGGAGPPPNVAAVGGASPAVTWMQTARARAAPDAIPRWVRRARTQTVAAHLAPLVHPHAVPLHVRLVFVRRRGEASRQQPVDAYYLFVFLCGLS